MAMVALQQELCHLPLTYKHSLMIETKPSSPLSVDYKNNIYQYSGHIGNAKLLRHHSTQLTSFPTPLWMAQSLRR